MFLCYCLFAIIDTLKSLLSKINHWHENIHFFFIDACSPTVDILRVKSLKKVHCHSGPASRFSNMGATIFHACEPRNIVNFGCPVELFLKRPCCFWIFAPKKTWAAKCVHCKAMPRKLCCKKHVLEARKGCNKACTYCKKACKGCKKAFKERKSLVYKACISYLDRPALTSAFRGSKF